ncbi:hypothetical protein HC928_11160 [bacterium]|nr:hypothetical protein [bacterium]
MATRNVSWLRGLWTLLVFRLLPLVMLAGILWSGWQVAGAVNRQLDERATFESQKPGLSERATALAPTVTPIPSQEPPTATATATSVSPTPTLEPSATWTPTPSVTRTLTLTATPSWTASATFEPATETVTNPPLAAPRSQFDVTNTPVGAIFATNTPAETGHNEVSPTPSATNPPPTIAPTQVPPPSPAPTATVTVTVMPPTATPTAEAQAAESTRPLPTVFFAVEPEEGLQNGGTAVPTRVPTVNRPFDLFNVLLIGGDDSLVDGASIRTDTMLVVSVNRETGTVSMLSLPRDLYVWIPSGFDGEGFMGRLNVAYGVGENIGYSGGGFGLLRQTILYNFGINVHYYARVNFEGFSAVIDALGGIDLAVDCAYQGLALIGAEVPGDAIEVGEDGLWTLPVGYYTMSGAEALWYARTRDNSDDFDRGRRQQQIIRAIWRAVRDTGRLDLTTLPNLWNQLNAIVDTDLALTDVLGLLPLALEVDVNDIEQFSLIRTYHTFPWQPPDGTFVQLPVFETLRPLLEDFYLPPTENELTVTGATIAVYNASGNADWDRVAADRLAWEGFVAWSAGEWEQAAYSGGTVLIDRTGQQKGSSRAEIAALLNVAPENILIEPDANREADFEVILGPEYDSCDAAVLDVEVP